jgi:hypothetical protein
MEKLQDEMKLRVLNAQSRKVKELEKTLTDTRKYYTDKVKELEHSVVLLRRGIAANPPPSASSAVGGGEDGSPAGDKRRSPPQQQQQGAARRSGSATSSGNNKETHHAGDGKGASEAISTHHQNHRKVAGDEAPVEGNKQHQVIATGEPEEDYAAALSTSSASSLPGGGAPRTAALVSSLQRENLELKKQLDAVIQQTAAIVSTPSVAAASFGLASSLQAQLSSLAGELALHKRLLAESQEMTRKAHMDWEDRLLQQRREAAKEMQLVRTEHDTETMRLASRHDAELKQLIAKQEAALEQHAAMVSSGLSHSPAQPSPGAKPSSSSSPSHHLSAVGVQGYLEAVAVKLQLLEHRQLAREAETEREVSEIRRVAAFETALERQKVQLVTEEKNQEILVFKSQLDQLLADLAALRGV